MTCPQTQLDAAYVLGALAPQERLEYERHLAVCEECARAVREIAGLPGLLAHLSLSDVDQVDLPPLPETLLPFLVREVRRDRRRRALVVASGAAAAAAGLAVALTLPPGDGGTATPAPRATPTATGAVMTNVGEAPVTAAVAMTSVAWGTRLDLTCSYAQDGAPEYSQEPVYSLVVLPRHGPSQQVATWKGIVGRTLHISAATATGKSDIRGVQVQDDAGAVVLTLSL
jgi:hypothetical protein